jgi:hypothetical protein
MPSPEAQAAEAPEVWRGVISPVLLVRFIDTVTEEDIQGFVLYHVTKRSA